MMLFRQRSAVLASIALLAFVGNQETGFMVSAQGADKEDKEDDADLVILPVEINIEEPPAMTNVTEDEMELPVSDDVNMTIFDDLDEGCMCDADGTITCSDPLDEESCSCDDMGDVICAEAPIIEAPKVAEAPVSAPVLVPDEPLAPDTGIVVSSAKSASTVVSAALSAAGLVVVLN
mmetsp:Transcript_26978/g.74168  ORF Transcript_26978/g.74168 Transcript_26978/m.74168 type:complete len:177 (+) Transcript_26978:174-704(+)|eukprot:CAMPEP_0172372872 /NCGR_PEP_ID=MMETSP1060-20121228/49454_1 /TAXON_ID=37318 /ORGANISM="Pseudo-nitzschia pungens, Strain cf. cingulata" /LENGTH=176 /DNA_ID=CAMNT_0013099011 /DNA_START=78 /DNA_END=608 /DNA_ORIENTATION=-